MSILLEALRKSEKNQHLRETPTIHTDNQPVPVSEPLPIRWLVMLLVVALLVIGWFIWRQYQQPAGTDQSPVTQEPAQAPAVAAPAGADKSPDQTMPSPLPDQAVPKSPPVSASTGQNRTPVESYQAPQSREKPSDPVAKTPAKNDRNAATASATPTKESRSGQTAETDLKEPAASPATGKPVKTPAEEFDPGKPAPISYWELPDAVRADLPDIKFSVLVYALKPADRFVLLNGQRLGEGDTAQPGLVVKEIRRDGVVFSYRLYNFLVER